jgi:type VI secretion system protein ImpJ
MSDTNKIVWSEGMFLRPQHFQQQDRYLERYIDGRCNAAGPYQWGLQELKLDTELLKLGKFAVNRARGVLPDGTPFDFPERDAQPPVLDIPDNTTGEMLYLCVPLQREGALEVYRGASPQSQSRYRAVSEAVRNSTADSGEEVDLELGQLCLSLKRDSEDLSGYATIGVARVVEKLADKPVKLDESYIPPLLDCAISPILTGLLTELRGLLHQRGEALAHRLVDSGRAGSAEIADYLLLQVINRIEPLSHHLASIGGLHPLSLYTELLQMAGELATFTTRSKRPPEFPPYQHTNLQLCFSAALAALRQCLSTVLEQTAIALELVERKYGIHVAAINDRSLLGSASFVLAAKADIAGDLLRSRFPAQVKVAPVEKVRELIGAQLPGIALSPLPVAPRQIPYHAGFTYFELDRTGELWRAMQNSGGFAVHLGADFPGITMELWAIRN